MKNKKMLPCAVLCCATALVLCLGCDPVKKKPPAAGAAATEAAPLAPNFSKAAEAEARDRRTAIERETVQLGADHAWAGKYYTGDGLGTNISLHLAPVAGVVFEWHGCLGVYGRNYGGLRAEAGAVQFDFELPNVAGKFGGIPDKYLLLRWGGRRYLIASDKIIEFCNAVNALEEPRPEIHGSFLMRFADWEKKVEGPPELPAEYLKYLLSKPVKAEAVAVGKSITREGNSKTRFVETELTLNVGSADGILPGIEFSLIEPEEVESATVERVEAHSCHCRMTQFEPSPDVNPKVGWKFSTRPRWREPVPTGADEGKKKGQE